MWGSPLEGTPGILFQTLNWVRLGARVGPEVAQVPSLLPAGQLPQLFPNGPEHQVHFPQHLSLSRLQGGPGLHLGGN